MIAQLGKFIKSNHWSVCLKWVNYICKIYLKKLFLKSQVTVFRKKEYWTRSSSPSLQLIVQPWACNIFSTAGSLPQNEDDGQFGTKGPFSSKILWV